MVKDSTADGYSLTQAFCWAQTVQQETKKEGKERETVREQDNGTWEVFIEIAGPCSSSHLRMQTQLCSLRELSSGKQRLCRDLYRSLHWVILQSPVRCVRGGIYVCLLSQLERDLEEKVLLSFLWWSKRWKGIGGMCGNLRRVERADSLSEAGN